MPGLPGKLLTMEHIIRRVYDETTQTLRTSSSGGGPVSVIINSMDDSIAVGDANTGDTIAVRPDGTIVVGLDSTTLGALENTNVTVLNELIPTAYDRITITSKNVNGDPLVVLYKSSGSTVATLTITYDGDGDIADVVRT